MNWTVVITWSCIDTAKIQVLENGIHSKRKRPTLVNTACNMLQKGKVGEHVRTTAHAK